MLLLDTDILIDIQRGHPPAVAWFDGLDEVPSIPGLVAMELIQGAKDTKQVRDARRLVAPLPVVWPTEADCQRALTDFAALHLTEGLGLLDSLIAACAIGLSASLCTFNAKHYAMIPGLTIEQPYVQ